MTKKRGGKYENKLYIEMPFDEALERFAGVKQQELDANLSKKKKPPGGKRPSDGKHESLNVVQLRNRRKAHHG